MRRIASLLTAVAVSTGCNGGDILKQMEGKAYDKAAKAVSQVLERERLEARREIRQRGTEGPAPVVFKGLDEQTAGGKGPIIRIYCHGEPVPTEVWADLLKLNWADQGE